MKKTKLSILGYLNESSKKQEFNQFLFNQLSPEEQEFYTIIDDMEGPIKFKSGAILYYDANEGKYYDKKKDMYLGNDELYLTEATIDGKTYKNYREFFRDMLAKYNVKSPAELTRDQKAEFFNEIELKWKADKK